MAEFNKNEKKSNKAKDGSDKRKLINSDIFKVSVFFTLLFLALIVFLGKFLAFDAEGAINNSYNRRSDSLKEKVIRGSILSREGDVLACTDLGDDGSEERIYPYGEAFFHVVGFESNGGLGLESSYNYYLLTSHANIFEKIAAEFEGKKVRGDSITTTLDVDLQLKANEALSGAEGAIIVMDPETGEILAMASEPGYDPNYIDEAWNSIISDEDSSVLLNRATQAALTPGSTFKLFTLLEYYRENGGNVDGFEYNCTGSISLSGATFGCPYGTAHGLQNLKEALANSCNCAFSEIGISLDITSFYENNVKMLFNTDLNLDIATAKSSFTLSEDDSDFMIMQTAFGQGETLVTPIHLAMLSCAVANGGVLMKPHLVSEVTDLAGNVVETFKSSEYAELMTEDEASFMKEYMRAVVTEGTAVSLSYGGNYIAYGKTGTAETNSDKSENYDHSWFTGFAESGGRTLVVCAMIENSQETGLTGVWCAKQIFDYYFGK